MSRSPSASMREHVAHGSRIVLVAIALLFFAGITTKIVVSGSLPFGSSQHWSVNENLGHTLQALAYSMWALAVLGQVGRRFIVGAVVLAISFPLEDQSLTLFTAIALISLSLWIGLRTIDHIRGITASTGRFPSSARLTMQ